MKRLKGSGDLIFDAVEETTNLVQRMHELAAKKSFNPLTIVEPIATLANAVKTIHDTTAAGVYETIRIVNRGIKHLFDVSANFIGQEVINLDVKGANSASTPLRSDAMGSRSWLIDHSEALLNGLYGDYLNKKDNALDLGISFRHQGKFLPLEKKSIAKAIPDATEKVCIFMHGLICTEWTWSISADRFYGDPAVNFGSLLKSDLGYTPLYIRYNTGRHVSENGQRLSDLFTQLIAAYPKKIKEIVLVGHSMGGLVARSAAYYGKTSDAPWINRLRHVFCIGSPHLGAPLEKAVNMLSSLLRNIKTVGTQVPAQILNSRSSGIKDLRFGYILDDEWEGRDPDAFFSDNRLNAPFLDGVTYCYIAATITDDPDHPLGILFGDILVRLPSASGKACEPARRIPFSSGFVFNGMDHMHLANHPDVYKVIRQSLEAAD